MQDGDILTAVRRRALAGKTAICYIVTLARLFFLL
jgi:hypothetical protein